MDNKLPALFNVNGSFGCGAYAAPEFHTAGDLVAHLDYLGVQRTLAWHVAARDLNPTWGNRRLLAEVAADSEAADRLIPALVVTPAVPFESGGMACVRDALASGRVRALRIFPKTSGFGLGQIERLVHEVASYRPVLLWDVRDTTGPQDARDLVALATRYPKVTVVCTQAMWPQFGTVLDLMWRCPNISIDTSWLHMAQAIELVVRHFGAERALFGLGPRAHYGAAVGALAHARISRAEREQIACRNAERLLDLAPSSVAPHEPSLLDDKPLWRRHRAGLPLEEVRIIDAHGHTAPHTRGWFLPETDLAEGLASMIERMDGLGIDRTLVSPEPALFGHALEGNREAEPLLAARADRLPGYLVYNPLYGEELQPHLDAFFDRGAYVGFKVLAGYWRMSLTDPRFGPVWACADRRRLPVLMHTWQGPYDAPEALTDIVPRYPNAVFLLGHAGGGDAGRRQAEELATAFPNVFLEFCGSFTSAIPWQATLSRVGTDRVVFGTDAVAHDAAWELARLLSTPVADRNLLPVLAGNIEGILAQAAKATGASPAGPTSTKGGSSDCDGMSGLPC